MKYSKTLFTICLLPFIAFTSQAFAASFQSLEQSAALLGVADSGSATNTDNAAVQYYNPAGMPIVGHQAISVSGIGVLANIKLKNATATDYSGNPTTGSTSGPKSRGFIPALHIIQPINKKFALGAGITVPFGLETVYSNNSIARYFATNSQIKTINFDVSAGYSLTNKLSVGVGFDVQRLSAEMDYAADGSAFGTPSAIPNDIYITNKGSDWGYGFNAGILYLLSPQTRLGLAYRSEVKHNMHGSSTVSGVPDTIAAKALAWLLGYVDSDVSANLTMPASTTFSIQQQVNKKWRLSFDAQYTQWSVFKSLKLTFSHPAHPNPPSETLNYHNAWRFAIGQSYQVNNKLTLRNGFAFDQTPTDTVYKSARIPGANRYWVTLGANYKCTRHIDIDAGYAFILFENSHINKSEVTPFGTTTLDASYRAYANLIGAQINYHFDS